MISRRAFLSTGAAAGLLAKRTPGRLSIGVTDWDLRQTGKVEAVALAAGIGFDGVEVSLGRRPEDGKLPMDNAELQARYLAAAKQHRIKIPSTCLDILHVNYLKSDKLGQKWVAEGIGITRKLKAQAMLAPFFGKGALTTPAEMDYVGDLLKELGREAERAGVLLALENTISAEDNARIIERSGSKAVRVYYDTGNSAPRGFDVVKEIRWLGKARIAQVHLKDGRGYLGEGKIDFAAVLKALADIGYEGFAVLETPSPSGSLEADMRRNLGYVRDLAAKTRKS